MHAIYRKTNIFVTKSNKRALSNSYVGKDYLGMLFFGGLSLGTGCLGIWQYNRYFEKINQLDHESRSFSDSSIEYNIRESISVGQKDTLGQNLNDPNLEFFEWVKDYKGRRIRLHGVFDHANEVLLGLRTAPISAGTNAQGLASNPQVSLI